MLNAVSNSTALTMGSIDQLLNSSSSKASNRSAGNNAAASNAASARSGVTYNLDSSPGSSPCNSHRSGMSIAISTGTSNGGNSSRAPSSRATSSGYRPLSNVFLDRCSLNNNNNNNKYLVGCKDGLPDEYRTHLLWDYYKVEPPNPMPKPELAALPPDAQQRLLLTEIIYCLSGVRGNYIVALPHDELSLGLAKYETRFSVHVHLDKSLAEMVHEILPLASHFMGIQKVIALTDGNGQVNNALNAALQNITHDFYVSCSQIHIKSKLHSIQMSFYMRRCCCSRPRSRCSRMI